jgi:hypothetical protein
MPRLLGDPLPHSAPHFRQGCIRIRPHSAVPLGENTQISGQPLRVVPLQQRSVLLRKGPSVPRNLEPHDGHYAPSRSQGPCLRLVSRRIHAPIVYRDRSFRDRIASRFARRPRATRRTPAAPTGSRPLPLLSPRDGGGDPWAGLPAGPRQPPNLPERLPEALMSASPPHSRPPVPRNSPRASQRPPNKIRRPVDLLPTTRLIEGYGATSSLLPYLRSPAAPPHSIVC